jgi:hypothetical protein
MDAWQPPPLPNGQTWVDLLSIYRTKPYLDKPYSKLLNSTWWVFGPRNGAIFTDELANFIETWIRKKLRTLSGGDLSEFTIFNPHIVTGQRRADRFFQGVNRVVCKDESVRIFLHNLLVLPPVEQAIWANVLLHYHPEIKKLPEARQGLTIEVGVLMYRIGLEKFGVC